MGDHFQILTICTGNMCRSPAAEALLAQAFANEPLIAVHSAGTRPALNASVDQHIDVLLRGCGIDATNHLTRPLSDKLVSHADLVLGMTKQHRSAAVRLVPAAVRRSFTLRGFASIAAAVPSTELDPSADSPADRIRRLISLAPGYRALDAAEDIEDPVGSDQATFDRVFTEIRDSVNAITKAVLT